MHTLRWLGVILMLLGTSVVHAYEPNSSASAERVIHTLYNHINFDNSEHLDYKVFAKAYQGYSRLQAEQKLDGNKHVMTVCDYSMSSNEKRLWVIDLDEHKVLLNTYVAHGQGSGEEMVRSFSNIEGSHQSSLGFYVTGQTYSGKHGYSLHLHGMDEGYNDAAYRRAIVVHGAGYVSSDFIAGTGRLGRSWGCPAVSNDVSKEFIDIVKEGTCLFIYYPQQDYLDKSYWLKSFSSEISAKASK